jgi:F420-non-reducing hydrogenase iron-sulfur subunit
MKEDNQQEEQQTEIVLFYCAQSLADREAIFPSSYSEGGVVVRLVMVPCSSKVEVGAMLKLIEHGVDGVEIVACPKGSCRFLIGNEKAEKRVKFAKNLLQEVGFGGDRLGITFSAESTFETLLAIARNRAEEAKKVGNNPMKPSHSNSDTPSKKVIGLNQ